MQDEAGEDGRGAPRLLRRARETVGPKLKRTALIAAWLGQLHHHGQLAPRGHRARADIGMPVEMPLTLGPVAGDLRAFGELRQGKVEPFAVGAGDKGDDPLHHPTCPRAVIQPGKLRPADIVIGGIAHQPGLVQRFAAGQRDDAVAFGLGEGVGQGQGGEHAGGPGNGPAGCGA